MLVKNLILWSISFYLFYLFHFYLSGKFGSVRCELLVGDEVVYSKDLGTPRPRTSQCPTVQSSPPRVSSLDISQEESCSSSQTTDELAVASCVESAEDPNASAESAAANSNNAVCVRLCSLIKAQLVKAHAEVTRRYGGQQLPMTLSDAANSVSPGSNPGEEVDITNPPVPPVVDSSAGTYLFSLLGAFSFFALSYLYLLPSLDVIETVEDVLPVDLNTSVPESGKSADVSLPLPVPLPDDENGSKLYLAGYLRLNSYPIVFCVFKSHCVIVFFKVFL